MADIQLRPFSIKTYVPDGDPDGLRIVEKSNWTGVGVVFNRTNYKQVVSRPEFDRTGVYVLVGGSQDSALPTVYVGEGDPVRDRLNQHYSKKDFWDWVVFFVTKDGSLNKAHFKYLESRLLELATAAKQCKLDNAQPSLPPKLSEADTAEAETYLLDVLSIFPLLGLGVFEKATVSRGSQTMYYIEAKGIAARGYEDPKGFVVCEGSQVFDGETPSMPRGATTLRNDLVEQGVIATDKTPWLFTQDHAFNSPSTAATVIQGRSANGRTEWKTKGGRTLKELQTIAEEEVGLENDE